MIKVNLIKLYDNIKNPLEEDFILKMLIECYKKDAGLYRTISRLYAQEPIEEPSMLDENHPLALSEYELKTFVGNLYKKHFDIIPEEVLKRDVFKRHQYNIGDKDSVENFAQYFFEDYLGGTKYFNWGYGAREVRLRHPNTLVDFQKKSLDVKYEYDAQVKHRIYINVKPDDIYSFAGELVNLFNEQDLDFVMKFQRPWRGRADVLVLYCKDNNFEKTLDLLNDLKNKKPELVANCSIPPIFTGVVDDWLGVSVEPKKLSNGSSYSYNGRRAELVSRAIGKVILNNLDDNTLNGLSKDIVGEIEKGTYNPEENKKFISFSEDMNQNAKATIAKFVALNEEDWIDDALYEKYGISCSDFTNGKELSIIREKLSEMTDLIITKIGEDVFLNQMRSNINEALLINGIDSDKFCFEINTKAEFLNQSSEKDNQQELNENTLNLSDDAPASGAPGR